MNSLIGGYTDEEITILNRDHMMQEVLNDVRKERERQLAKWNGIFVDDDWSPLDWHEMIADYNGWARRMMTQHSPDKARNRYIQIAALAVAAVEALDRKYP